PVATILGATLPVRMVRPTLTSSRGWVSGGSPSIIAMRRELLGAEPKIRRQRLVGAVEALMLLKMGALAVPGPRAGRLVGAERLWCARARGARLGGGALGVVRAEKGAENGRRAPGFLGGAWPGWGVGTGGFSTPGGQKPGGPPPPVGGGGWGGGNASTNLGAY